MFDLKKPCSDCPYLKKGGIRLRPGRVKSLAEDMLSPRGSFFTCHKTLEDADEEEEQVLLKDGNEHCAGALIFALKHDNHTRPMRLAIQLEMFNPEQYDEKTKGLVFDSLEQMLDVNRREL